MPLADMLEAGYALAVLHSSSDAVHLPGIQTTPMSLGNLLRTPRRNR